MQVNRLLQVRIGKPQLPEQDQIDDSDHDGCGSKNGCSNGVHLEDVVTSGASAEASEDAVTNGAVAEASEDAVTNGAVAEASEDAVTNGAVAETSSAVKIEGKVPKVEEKHTQKHSAIPNEPLVTTKQVLKSPIHIDLTSDEVAHEHAKVKLEAIPTQEVAKQEPFIRYLA